MTSDCADVVIWDSHPLALGATPKQVFIDGIPQLAHPTTREKPFFLQRAPWAPDYDREAADAVRFEGLPPLQPHRYTKRGVVFVNVANVWMKSANDTKNGVDHAFQALSDGEERGRGVVVVEDGRVICYGVDFACAAKFTDDYEVFDLRGGALQPGLVTAGSSVGLQEIAMESSTTDGLAFDLLSGNPPDIVGGAGYMPKAADGLIFGTRDAL